MPDPDTASLVKSALPLSKYVARFTSTIRGSQGRYRSVCVAHGGDNPNGMSIDDNQGVWKCWSGDCGGGSIIDLWMRQHDTDDFVEALSGLAAELGVHVPERADQGPSQRRVADALDAVAHACHEHLFEDESESARATRRYLKGRGVKKSVARRYMIGALPPGQQAADVVRGASDDIKALQAAGVLNERGDWSQLNGRLLFPIRDAKGKVVSFGGRVVPDVDHSLQAKYVNTASSQAYDKSSVLYGMEELSESTSHVVVVEGYLDRIAVNEADDGSGVKAVATCGTSLTGAQARILARHSRVSMMRDGDEAGVKATASSIWLANYIPDRLDVVHLDPGSDPWDMYLEDSEGLLDEVNRGTSLIPAVVQSKWASVGSDRQRMDEWVRSVAGTLDYTSHRELLLEQAAKVAGQEVASYKRGLTVPDISQRRHDQGPSQIVSSAASTLASGLLGMEPQTMSGVMAGLRAWSTRTGNAVENWLPVHTDVDAKVVKRLALGPQHTVDPEVDRVIAGLMTSGRGEGPDMGMMLKGMARQLLNAISTMSSKGEVEQYLASQVPTLRRALEACRDRDHQESVLAYLIDTSLDVERAMESSKGRGSTSVA